MLSFPDMCEPLPDIDNGTIDYRGETTYNQGLTVYFYCNEGYTRVGPGSSECVRNTRANTSASWNQPTPTCMGNVVNI